MSITVKNLSVSINGVCSSGFDINLDGTLYRLDDFVLEQRLLSSNHLSFSMHKGPVEEINEIMFSACGQIIGKEITVNLQTENIESVSLNAESDSVADVNFKGVILSASGSRSGSEYTVHVEACSWDVLLEDNPACRSYENNGLNEIVRNVLDDYSGHLDAEVDARFTEKIPYCVQYNETHFQFLRRLAGRYGEWLYNDGTQLVFGNLKKQDSVRLSYPSKDMPAYHVELKMRHVAFHHTASSYNAYDSTRKDGLAEMQKEYNSLSEQVFQASQECYSKPTLQHLRSGGYADTDSRETILGVSTKTQGRGEKAGMLTYSGKTYSSKLKLGSTLVVVDNYITDSTSNTKSEVVQDGILITGLVHRFSADETYSNEFTGIPADCDFPPYSDTDVYPAAASCRAKVIDNEDPNNLGRIRVQFDWQAQLDAKMITPWLRIAQPYAGGGKGFSFIPEVGEEVMVDFEGGNAERPYVKGTLYNGVGSPDGDWVPGGNKDNQVKAIRTRNGHTIEIHDENGNGYIRIYDHGKENYILTFSTDEKLIKLESTGNIELYAENDIIMKAGNDMKITVGNNRTLDVGTDDATTVGNNQTLQVGGDRTKSVQGNENNAIEGDQVTDIKGSKDERITDSNYMSAKEYREEIDNEVIVLAKSQQYKSSSFTKIDAGMQIDIKATIAKIN